ncbi:MAG: Rhodanese-like protein [Bacteroidetes bacterium]|jgi:rhodanese-related sulfurtransferase|nr:Rhodanese-like protein [Bacteroidota bacterium]
MIQRLRKLIGLGPKVNLAELIAGGATILDVRTPAEYLAGHAKGSVNIPLDRLSAQLKKLKDKDHPVITCCASGMRSASAKSYLKSQGYTQVHNGGSWYAVERQCNQ